MKISATPLDWGMTNLPDFKKFAKKGADKPLALVLPGAFYSDGVALMTEAGFARAGSVAEADVVVFMGGSDVDPRLYGEKPLSKTYSSPSRDDIETRIYDECLAADIPMFGICRGAQFLHVKNGGKLWQDVNNHGGTDHIIYDLDDHVIVEANSYHHQMLQDAPELDVIAVTRQQVATKFSSQDFSMTISNSGNKDAEIEIEAGAYHKTKCFFVQGHPEVGSPEYRSWCLTKLHDHLFYWQDSYGTIKVEPRDLEAKMEEREIVEFEADKELNNMARDC